LKQEFINQDRWDRSYDLLQLRVAPPDDPIRSWLEQQVPPGRGRCIELGCFPGRYLAVLGELGYEVNGIDRTPRITPDLRDWMQAQGYRVGEFTCGDVFANPVGGPYDIVCSFGLIEHFGQWKELLELHARMVAKNGLLVVSTPNFRGAYQRLLHQWLDPVNLAEHNLEAMQPMRWSEIAQALGFEVQMCGYIGPYDFWVGPQPRSILQKIVVRALGRLKPFGRCLPHNVGTYAPYCGMVARRTGRA
jgi:2-polyprenyl-3-methyl-5-hydroxy-6-metoxy-1,4-benzoquinol methylase